MLQHHLIHACPNAVGIRAEDAPPQHSNLTLQLQNGRRMERWWMEGDRARAAVTYSSRSADYITDGD